MLRDPSLIPLSHQHHNGLALCVLTDRALAANSTPASVQQLAQRIIDRYEIESSINSPTAHRGDNARVEI